MVLIRKNTYQETRNIVLGHKDRSQILDEFSGWLKDEFDIDVLNFEFGKMSGPNKRYRLYIIVKSAEDKKKMKDGTFTYNAGFQHQIGTKFKELNQKYRFTEEYKLIDLFVAFGDFARDAKTLANWAAVKKARKILKDKYDLIWCVHSQFENTVVFYYLTHQILENEKNGINDQITKEYYQVLQKYDEFNLFLPDTFVIRFDSKENLDENYEGNLFYYDK